MSGMNTYKKKVEAYIAQQDATAKSASSSKGLLSPKVSKTIDVKKEKDAVEKVSEFVYALRQKRKEIISDRNKK